MIKRNSIPNYTYDKLAEDYPGRITNETLLKDFDEYLREDDEDDPTNFVVRDDVMEGYDYKLVPRKVWKLLEKRFEGRAIIRSKDSDIYNRKYVIKFPSVRLYILSNSIIFSFLYSFYLLQDKYRLKISLSQSPYIWIQRTLLKDCKRN